MGVRAPITLTTPAHRENGAGYALLLAALYLGAICHAGNLSVVAPVLSAYTPPGHPDSAALTIMQPCAHTSPVNTSRVVTKHHRRAVLRTSIVRDMKGAKYRCAVLLTAIRVAFVAGEGGRWTSGFTRETWVGFHAAPCGRWVPLSLPVGGVILFPTLASGVVDSTG